MGDILVCRETWTPKIRMAYKLTTCTFQFVVPVLLVVSGFDREPVEVFSLKSLSNLGQSKFLLFSVQFHSSK